MRLMNFGFSHKNSDRESNNRNLSDMSISPRDSWDVVLSKSNTLSKTQRSITLSKTFNGDFSSTQDKDFLKGFPDYLRCNMCNTVIIWKSFINHLTRNHSNIIDDSVLSSLKNAFNAELGQPLVLFDQIADINDDTATVEIKSQINESEFPCKNGLNRFDQILTGNKKFLLDIWGPLLNNFTPIHNAISSRQTSFEKYGPVQDSYVTSNLFNSQDFNVLNDHEKLFWLNCEKDFKQINQRNPLLLCTRKPNKTGNDLNGQIDEKYERKLDISLQAYEIDKILVDNIMALKAPMLKVGIESTDKYLPHIPPQTKVVDDLKQEPIVVPIQESQTSLTLSVATSIFENNRKQHPIISIIPKESELLIHPTEITPTNQDKLSKQVTIEKNGIAIKTNMSGVNVNQQCVNNMSVLSNMESSDSQSTMNGCDIATTINPSNRKRSYTNQNNLSKINPFSPQAQIINGIEKNASKSNRMLGEFDSNSSIQAHSHTSPVQTDTRVQGVEAVPRMSFIPTSNTHRVSSNENYSNNQHKRFHGMPCRMENSQNHPQFAMVNNVLIDQNYQLLPRTQSIQPSQLCSVSQHSQRHVIAKGGQLGPVSPMCQPRPICNTSRAFQGPNKIFRLSNMHPRPSVGQSPQMIQHGGINQPNMMMQPVINQQNANLQSSHMSQQDVLNYFKQSQQTKYQNPPQDMTNNTTCRNQAQGYHIRKNMMEEPMYMGNSNLNVVKNPGRETYVNNPRFTLVKFQPDTLFQQVINSNDNRTIIIPDTSNQQVMDLQMPLMNRASNYNSIRYHGGEDMFRNDMMSFQNPQPYNNSQPSMQRQTGPINVQSGSIQFNPNSNYYNNNMMGIVNYQNKPNGNHQQNMAIGNQNLANFNNHSSNNFVPNGIPTYNIAQPNYNPFQPQHNLLNGNPVVLINNNTNNSPAVYVQPNIRYFQNHPPKQTRYVSNIQQYTHNRFPDRQ